MTDPDDLVQAIADGLTVTQAAERFGVSVDEGPHQKRSFCEDSFERILRSKDNSQWQTSATLHESSS